MGLPGPPDDGIGKSIVGDPLEEPLGGPAIDGLDGGVDRLGEPPDPDGPNGSDGLLGPPGDEIGGDGPPIENSP
ncbi:MAG: hypothetical protein RI544_08180, partial [Haloquadratum sp.]|nr:hypothetical protein [Haloquadratum sp.]